MSANRDRWPRPTAWLRTPNQTMQIDRQFRQEAPAWSEIANFLTTDDERAMAMAHESGDRS